MLHLDAADRHALGVVAVYAAAVSLAVIGVALLAGLALRIFEIASGM